MMAAGFSFTLALADDVAQERMNVSLWRTCHWRRSHAPHLLRASARRTSCFGGAMTMRSILSSCALVLTLVACADPVTTRCIEEQKTYCNRMFACVAIDGLVGFTVNYEDESDCTTEETKRCDTVTSENPCPGGTSSSYSEGTHDECIADQGAQDCAAFADRPSSCSSYCSSSTD